MSARYEYEFIGEEFYVAVDFQDLVEAAGVLARVVFLASLDFLASITRPQGHPALELPAARSPTSERLEMTCQRPIDKAGSLCLVRHGTPKREIPWPPPKH